MNEISVDGNEVRGVKLSDGRLIEAKCVLSNATAYHTSSTLLRNSSFYHESDHAKDVASIDYTSPVTKING